MKKLSILLALVAAMTTANRLQAQSQPATTTEAQAKSDAEVEKRASEWVSSLGLNDSAKATRVQQVISTHLKAVRDWHNSHPGTDVPETDPQTGKKLNGLERQFIADSAMPKSVHEDLMAGLRKDLTEEQVEAILDKYTIGKVAFTMGGYRAIVPDLTNEEEAVILGYLKQAREEAVDYKGAKLISMVFEKYKTKCEQYLNSNGRDWRALYKAFVKSVQEKKKAAAAEKAKSEKPAE